MKMSNKKGFVLVETLVVTLFVTTLFILVYQNLIPAIGEYESLNNYDDIDSVYASNLFTQSLLRYGNTDYIDNYLTSHTYLDITDCSNTDVYKNSDYCRKIKTSLNILEDDYIFITKYNISEFRNETKTNEFFDSGKLSNFKSYVDTVSDVDSFYDGSDPNFVGKYRLFITRTVTNVDKSTSLKYTNLGIYTGGYKRYNMGETVTFEPGTGVGNLTFYVLKNSPSTESDVTLILNQNVGANTGFNTTGTTGSPDSVLSVLKASTDSWTNANLLTSSTQYVSNNGYTISYNGYRARLLEPNDIYEILGTKINDEYFTQNILFSVSLTDSTLQYLYNGLSGDAGYWMANMVSGNDEMAWAVKNEMILPNFLNNTTENGVRPVIVISKDRLK